MTRSQPSRGGEGAVRGTGPLSGSADSHIDHAADRQALWGDVREWAEDPKREPAGTCRTCQHCGRGFAGQRQLTGHLGQCEERPNE